MTKKESYWDEDLIIKDMLFGSKSSITDIANYIGLSFAQTRAKIKALGLDWVIDKNRKLSKGHSVLTELFRELLPNYEVTNEHYIGAKLHLDVYVPAIKLAAEYHGRQHFYYTSAFHKDKYDFERGVANDEHKAEICQEKGISLVVFRYNDELNLDVVTDRIVEAMKNCEPVMDKKKTSLSAGSEYYEKAKERRNEQRRAAYRKMKDNRSKK